MSVGWRNGCGGENGWESEWGERKTKWKTQMADQVGGICPQWEIRKKCRWQKWNAGCRTAHRTDLCSLRAGTLMLTQFPADPVFLSYVLHLQQSWISSSGMQTTISTPSSFFLNSTRMQALKSARVSGHSRPEEGLVALLVFKVTALSFPSQEIWMRDILQGERNFNVVTEVTLPRVMTKILITVERLAGGGRTARAAKRGILNRMVRAPKRTRGV